MTDPRDKDPLDRDEEVPMTDEPTDLDAFGDGPASPTDPAGVSAGQFSEISPGNADEFAEFDILNEEPDDLRPTIGLVAGSTRRPPRRARRADRGPRSRRFDRKSKLTRRVSGLMAMLFALIALGFAYEAFLPSSTSAAADNSQVAAGQRIFQNSCIACHGANLQGVSGRGPSLIGVGQAAVYFQVSTGRMPAVSNGAQEPRKLPQFDEDQTDALAAYVESLGGGPEIPALQADKTLQDRNELAKGGELYRLNCASCHNFTGQGGALSQGKYAPSLDEATDQQIYGAMLSGPENMPKFGDGQLSDSDKRAIIAFVQNNKQTLDPGGYSLGGFGPAPEGLIAFLVGMGAIVALIMWMGSRA